MDGDCIVILFGAGVYAKKYKALLEYLNMEFHYFTDNDSSKWTMKLYGKPVIPPSRLKQFPKCKIIISSTHEQAIRKQLTEMELADKIMSLEELYHLCGQKMTKTDRSGLGITVRDNVTVLVDMYEGIGWGGTELWAAGLAFGLKSAGRNVLLIGGTEQPPLEARYETLTIRITEHDTIMHMVELMEQNLPCIFINNFAGCAFMAAIIVKKKYPDSMHIVSVIHNDNPSLFDAHMMLSKYIEKIFCVSSQIREHMQEQYVMPNQCCYFKEQPIETDILREIRPDTQVYDVLRLGYAARLVRQQKRADLLIEFIKCLEERGFDYIFQIAGEGECRDMIMDYVRHHHLERKVELLGRLPKSEMQTFWKRQDIFINISEYEGTSLSMLEAMSCGCVPVVTDVSGAKEFITHGENGYICDIGDLKMMAQYVASLDNERKKLASFGRKCQIIIKERCNPEEYIKYWIKNLLN